MTPSFPNRRNANRNRLARRHWRSPDAHATLSLQLVVGGMRVRRRQEEEFEVVGIADRMTPYEAATVPEVESQQADEDLVERAATLLAVMPRNQLRATIENLLSPHDRERGRKAVDALIDAAFAIEDETGHLRKIA